MHDAINSIPNSITVEGSKETEIVGSGLAHVSQKINESPQTKKNNLA